MQPTWLIEAGVYGSEIDPLRAEILRQGMACEIVSHRLLDARVSPLVVGGRSLGDGDCVLGYGTFPFAQQILLRYRWRPGAWCSADNLDCAEYYPHFDRYLLNRKREILAGHRALDEADRIFREFGDDEMVFIRPTSCLKSFVGRVVDRESFSVDLAATRYDRSVQVVVARPRAIGREWRLIVVGDRVVSGSRYAVGGDRDVAAECPDEVAAFATAILGAVSWRPDPAFMLDIGETDEGLRVVELNSFSGSWLYHCDYEAVVAAVRAVLRVEPGA